MNLSSRKSINKTTLEVKNTVLKLSVKMENKNMSKRGVIVALLFVALVMLHNMMVVAQVDYCHGGTEECEDHQLEACNINIDPTTNKPICPCCEPLQCVDVTLGIGICV
ncbi:hypothetical protein RND81_05G199500 [Saponaria officinalis]|uniref:Transmembrane protein n=1 Tax=Saponaria officinalis TaxID=3572 RepID=A0AAW1KZ83_SAPOF